MDFRSTQEYKAKVASESQSSQTLYTLGWKTEELSKLAADGRHVTTKINVLLDHLITNPSGDVRHNVHVIGKALTASAFRIQLYNLTH